MQSHNQGAPRGQRQPGNGADRRPVYGQPPGEPPAPSEPAAAGVSRREAAASSSHSPNGSLPTPFARIKVVGVGGAGGNAINRMIEAGVQGIEFVSVNTDAQALTTCQAPIYVRIGDKMTRGLGAGGRPEIGERAAEESADTLAELVRNTDMVFITAGMGGGTGTGASPIIAKLAKAAGALTVGVVTKPFDFEGTRRRRAAEEGISRLRDTVDALITIPNERLLQMVDPKTPITDAFRLADEVLRQGIGGISDLITKPGIINLDFADVKTIMHDAGSALMAIGYGTGDTRCIDAAKEAIESPLLEMSIQGATGVLYNITGGSNLTLLETSEAAEIIRAAVDEDAEIIYGTSIDASLGDAVTITLIATGFDNGDDFDRPVSVRRPHREREREMERPVRQQAQPRSNGPRQAAGAPIFPEDDWSSESSIIRFLRER
ncbi:MAG TPA: cell division protein FtsZ [Thermomicrobiales bacterium]|nr:cell division protein FtsZ [Thermomicrobiales bacterium]